MTEDTRPADDRSAPDAAAAQPSVASRIVREIRETLVTIAVFIPFWLVFSTFIYELRSIPSESMVPALQVGDRVAVRKFAFGYNRNSVPFGMGRWFLSDDEANPGERVFGGTPRRGDVLVFKHPRQDLVMIKRTVGLPGDEIQMRAGQLYVNGEAVSREVTRTYAYVEDGDRRPGRTVDVTEYRETLPGENGSHLIVERSDDHNLDATPVFRVPEGHVFMMGDNRDNSLDSRDPTGHPALAQMQPYDWTFNGPAPPGRRDGMGFVPLDHIIGRADTVLFSLHSCRKSEGAECLKSGIWKPL